MNVIAVDNSRAGNLSSIQLAPLPAIDLNTANGVQTAGRVFEGHGEGDKGPHRQYGIYSIHVHHLISPPLPHDNNDLDDDVLDPLLSPPLDHPSLPYSSNINECHGYQSPHDQSLPSDHAPSCSSNSNDCHAYQNPHAQSLPSNPSDPASIPLSPIPSASSFGESVRGQGLKAIGGAACSGSTFQESDSYTGTPQTTNEPSYTIRPAPCSDGTDDVANGVSGSGDIEGLESDNRAVLGNPINTIGDEGVEAASIRVGDRSSAANDDGTDGYNGGVLFDNLNHTVGRDVPSCCIDAPVITGGQCYVPMSSVLIPSALSFGASVNNQATGEMARGDGIDSGVFVEKSDSYSYGTQTTGNANCIHGVAYPYVSSGGVDGGLNACGQNATAGPGDAASSEIPVCIDGRHCIDSVSDIPNHTVSGSSPANCIDSTSSTNTFQLPQPPLYVVKDESSLNRSDLQEIHQYEDMLDGFQRRLLRMIEKKIAKHPQRYDRDNYLQTAAFLILSNWPSAQRLAYCGIPSAVNPSGRCRLHQFCPYFCWRERNQAQLAYVPSFHDGNWHFLTGSFDGDLAFTGSDGFDWLHYWDAYKYGLSALVKEGLIDGVYWTEELAVNGFQQTMVLPHVHCIIDAFELTDTTIDILKEHIIEHLAKNLGPDFLLPDVKYSAIQDQKGLLDRIGYMVKPMKLLKAYERAWVGAFCNARSRVWQLNSQLTDIIRGHSEITRRRPKMRAKGTLDSRTKGFIGVRKENRSEREYQELINELKKQPTEYIQDVADEAALAA